MSLPIIAGAVPTGRGRLHRGIAVSARGGRVVLSGDRYKLADQNIVTSHNGGAV